MTLKISVRIKLILFVLFMGFAGFVLRTISIHKYKHAADIILSSRKKPEKHSSVKPDRRQPAKTDGFVKRYGLGKAPKTNYLIKEIEVVREE